jgi:hypothetical protein
MQNKPVLAEDLLKEIGLQHFVDVQDLSDGSHSYGELYDHRSILFMSLLAVLERVELSSFGERQFKITKSHFHADGAGYENYFLAMVINLKTGEQISYHLDTNEYWGMCPGEEVEPAPEWDGHTSNDVVTRLISWFL